MEDCNSTASQINPERLLSMSLPSHQDNCSSDMNVDHNSLLFRLFSAHPLAHVQIDSIQQDLIVADPRVFEVSDEQDALLRSAFETIMISTVDILKESVLPGMSWIPLCLHEAGGNSLHPLDGPCQVGEDEWSKRSRPEK
ncbi:hypothetical protein BDEG_21705 [Batrachochytrium dendrobatidis JEL423]|uniref:Uncharacterized protein n=1 Tax=Batrachochytrium dendrobatidis (strain JEL423) TaxID=403673 RepID=A0A177WCA3_BATDL|nr:hypothetical protein BDEG_21705 [Batrachochytrium dendrobatidis JEL423]